VSLKELWERWHDSGNLGVARAPGGTLAVVVLDNQKEETKRLQLTAFQRLLFVARVRRDLPLYGKVGHL
jgi:hypothetical protein